MKPQTSGKVGWHEMIQDDAELPKWPGVGAPGWRHQEGLMSSSGFRVWSCTVVRESAEFRQKCESCWRSIWIQSSCICICQSAPPGVVYFTCIPVVPHKAVTEVSEIGNLEERLVVVNQGWQSESTDGPTGGWGGWGLLFFSLSFSLSLTIYLPTYLLPTPLSLCLFVCLSVYLSI